MTVSTRDMDSIFGKKCIYINKLELITGINQQAKKRGWWALQEDLLMNIRNYDPPLFNNHLQFIKQYVRIVSGRVLLDTCYF